MLQGLGPSGWIKNHQGLAATRLIFEFSVVYDETSRCFFLVGTDPREDPTLNGLEWHHAELFYAFDHKSLGIVVTH